MEKIYYYSTKYPEYGINKIDVYDEVYLSTSKEKYLYALVTKYSFESGRTESSEIWSSVCTCEDEELMYSETRRDCYLLSYNYYKIYKKWVESTKNRRDKLNKSLRRLEQETMKESEIL